MKKLLLLLLAASAFTGAQAQTGISAAGTAPDAAAMMDVIATDKGFMVPRVALTALNAAGPVTGLSATSTSLLVYNTASAGVAPNDVTPGFYYWNNATTSWIRILSGSANLTAGNDIDFGTSASGSIDVEPILNFVHTVSAPAGNNLNLNAASGFAAVVNANNGTTGATQTFRIGNGAGGADVFYVQANGTFYSANQALINSHAIIGGNLSVTGTSSQTGAATFGTSVTISPFTTAGIVTNTSAGLLGTTVPGTSGYLLSSSNTGTVTWVNPASLGVKWNAITDPDGALTLNHGTNATIFNFTNTTTAGFTMNANSLSTGSGLSLASTGTITVGGEVLNVAANNATTGSAVRIQADGLTSGSALEITSTGTATTNARRLISVQSNGANAGANGVSTGIQSMVSNTGTTLSNIAGQFIASSTTVDATNRGLDVRATGTTTGSTNLAIDISAPSGAVNNTAGTTTYKGAQITSGALTQTTGGTTFWTGLDVNMPTQTQTAGTIISRGLNISGGTVNSGTAYAITTSASAGNVGIATTTPFERLHIDNGAVLAGTATATNGSLILAGKYNGSNDYLNTLGSQFSSGGTVLAYAVKPIIGGAGYASSTTIAIPRTAINLDGAFSVLTAASQTTAVGTAVAMTSRFSVSNTGVVNIPNLGTTATPVYVDASSNLTTTGPTSGNIGYWTRTGTNLYNTTLTDNVGIGTSSPTAKLSVGAADLTGAAMSTTFKTNAGALGGTATNENILASIGYTSTNQSALGIRAYRSSNGADWQTSAILLEMDVDATARVNNAYISINANGAIGIGTIPTANTYKLNVSGGKLLTAGIDENSDARLKQNINPIYDALSKVTQMRGVTYNWRTEEFPERNFEKDLQFGLIAQELEKVIPELVTTDGDGYKAIEYSHLVPVLIEAIKELDAKNNEQKVQLDKQTKTNEELKASIENLLIRMNAVENNTEVKTNKAEK